MSNYWTAYILTELW